MIADNFNKTPHKSVKNGTTPAKKRIKQSTNLSLSGDCVAMAKALKSAKNRPSISNLIEVLIEEAYKVLTPEEKELAKKLSDTANGNRVHSIAA